MTLGPTAAVARFVAETHGRAIPDAALTLARTAFVDVTATTRAELVAKYRECAALSVDVARATRALALLETLEEVRSVATRMEVLRG